MFTPRTPRPVPCTSPHSQLPAPQYLLAGKEDLHIGVNQILVLASESFLHVGHEALFMRAAPQLGRSSRRTGPTDVQEALLRGAASSCRHEQLGLWWPQLADSCPNIPIPLGPRTTGEGRLRRSITELKTPEFRAPALLWDPGHPPHPLSLSFLSFKMGIITCTSYVYDKAQTDEHIRKYFVSYLCLLRKNLTSGPSLPPWLKEGMIHWILDFSH